MKSLNRNTVQLPAEDDDAIVIARALKSLKQKSADYQEQLLRAQQEACNLQSEKDAALRESEEAKRVIEQLKREKEKVQSRLGGIKRHLKRAVQTCKDVRGELVRRRNRIGYLEKLLSFEERSGFSTLYLEMQFK